MQLKFRYCEKAQKFEKNLQFLFEMLVCSNINTKREILKKIMAFSEYLNFNHNDPFGFLRHAKGTEKDFDSICLHAPKDT